jgi:AcrR family transcriptional regulator
VSTRARRDREKEERRQSILQAAREVFFENGFHRATVDAVAKRAEVSKGTVYLYFMSKETILAHLLLEGLDELGEKLKLAFAADESFSAESRLRRLGCAYRRFFLLKPQYFRFMVAMDRGRFREAVSPQVYQETLEASMKGLNWVVQAVKQGVENGVFRCGDARLAAATLWAALNGVLELMEHPLRREMVGVDCEALYNKTLEAVIRGLRAPQDDKGGA